MKTHPAILLSIILSALLVACGPEDTRDPTLILAEGGDPAAQFEWANQLIGNTGILAEESKQSILQWLSKSADAGHLPARTQLTSMLIEGQFGNERIQGGFKRLEALAQEGHPKSQSTLARLLEVGKDIGQDLARAGALFQAASDQNDPYAMYRIAQKTFLDEKASLNRSEELRLESMLIKAGEGGIGEAYYLLGTRAETDKDEKTAEEWYYKAAQLEHPHGMYRAGLAYQRSGHHAIYAPLGFDYLSKAVAAGSTEALYPLSLSYRKGYGTEKDDAKADELNHTAALIRDQKAIDAIILKIYEYENWTYEQNVEITVWMNRSPDLGLKIRRAISARLQYSDDFFFKQSYYRSRQMDLAAKTYLAKIDSERTGPTEEERRILDQPYSARYGELEELFLQARSDKTGLQKLELGKALLASPIPKIEASEAIQWIQMASQLGTPDAGLLLYKHFQEGLAKIEESEAIRLLHESSSLGNAEAMHLYAHVKLEAATSDKDYPNIIGLLLDASENGYPEDRDKAYELIREEHGLDPQDARIRRAMQSMADDGNTHFAYLIATHDLERSERRARINSFPPTHVIANEIIRLAEKDGRRLISPLRDRSKTQNAIKLTQERSSPTNISTKKGAIVRKIFDLADQGYPAAKFHVSVWKFFGFYTPQDRESATATWKELHANSPTADIHLIRSICLSRGYLEERDAMTAASFARQAAEEGNEYAIKYFSDLGDKVPRYKFLFDTIYRATELREPEAMLELSERYMKSTFFSKDEGTEGRLKWLSEAAKQGNAQAMKEIGVCFLKGEGVEKNITRAIRYLEESAKLGEADAQYLMGFVYTAGKDIPKDIKKAVSYLQMAADQGFSRAKNLLESIRSMSDGSEIEDESEGAIQTALLSAALHRDYFPVKPYTVAAGEFQLITNARSNRGAFALGKQTKTAGKEMPYVFLAGDNFAKQEIEVTKHLISTPLIETENGLVFTGNEPASTYTFKSKLAIENCIALLVVRDDKTSYTWKRIGKMSPDKEYKVRFSIEDSFFKTEDIAVYFFENGTEIASNARHQIHHFISDLEDFTKKRNNLINDRPKGDYKPIAYKDVSSYIYGIAQSLKGVRIVFHISKLGFVKNLVIEGATDPEIRSKLLAQLSQVTAIPQIVDGSPTESKIGVTLK